MIEIWGLDALPSIKVARDAKDDVDRVAFRESHTEGSYEVFS